tara:strand:- start:872 stop:1066 length:195 start_codon:yes stop_codon:yes gene_type:complete
VGRWEKEERERGIKREDQKKKEGDIQKRSQNRNVEVHFTNTSSLTVGIKVLDIQNCPRSFYKIR